MGGDDFQKDGPNLRLRDAIEETLSLHDSLVKEKAADLFTEMEIIEEVKLAIDAGRNDCKIYFPSDMKQYPAKQYTGQMTYENVVEALISLLTEEGVSCTAYDSDGDKMVKANHEGYSYNYVKISGFILR